MLVAARRTPVFRALLERVATALLGRFLLAVALVVPALGVALLLSGGTEVLLTVGFSRRVAGPIAAGAATIGSVVGLAAFGYFVVEW
ncbi:hypothetical protein C485_08327 [Natrinema altunense JCM 12890]|uniref:Uncharacterized protein n=1 Tax=Natrinema altunense (strain JCM 12890 / CGMCC 1.3731 / AJ2) TaxID=1227494 RepID=L9ZP23_NATA2|nr:hypothetical protein C485_08327 [Natrinema altunense JCM 12890]